MGRIFSFLFYIFCIIFPLFFCLFLKSYSLRFLGIFFLILILFFLLLQHKLLIWIRFFFIFSALRIRFTGNNFLSLSLSLSIAFLSYQRLVIPFFLFLVLVISLTLMFIEHVSDRIWKRNKEEDKKAKKKKKDGKRNPFKLLKSKGKRIVLSWTWTNGNISGSLLSRNKVVRRGDLSVCYVCMCVWGCLQMIYKWWTLAEIAKIFACHVILSAQTHTEAHPHTYVYGMLSKDFHQFIWRAEHTFIFFTFKCSGLYFAFSTLCCFSLRFISFISF